MLILKSIKAAEYFMRCYSLSTRRCLPGTPNAVRYIATSAMASSTCFSTCLLTCSKALFCRKSIAYTFAVSKQQPRHSGMLVPASNAALKAGMCSQLLAPDKVLLAASPGVAMPECATGTAKSTGSVASLLLPGPEDRT